MNISFAFDSMSDFFTMGSHGSYVWTAWAIGVLFLVALVWHSVYIRVQLKKRLHWQHQQRMAKNTSSNAPSNTPSSAKQV